MKNMIGMILRETCSESQHGKRREPRHSDSINWQAVRQANVDDIAEIIKIRGQHKNIAKRIKVRKIK